MCISRISTLSCDSIVSAVFLAAAAALIAEAAQRDINAMVSCVSPSGMFHSSFDVLIKHCTGAKFTASVSADSGPFCFALLCVEHTEMACKASSETQKTTCQSARCFDPRWPPESQHGCTASRRQGWIHRHCRCCLPGTFTPFVFIHQVLSQTCGITVSKGELNPQPSSSVDFLLFFRNKCTKLN